MDRRTSGEVKKEELCDTNRSTRIVSNVPSKLRGCAAAHTELLPRSWNFSIITVNILLMHIRKNFQSAAQSSGRTKIFCSEQQQVRAAVQN
jgi:hypothetical protein